MYELILSELEGRNLATATLGELSQIANTVARYGGLGFPDEVEDVSKMSRDERRDLSRHS